MRAIIERLNEYDPESLEVEPEYTRDLLKQLYQYLIPPQIRHDLGEYYTPDWLAECILNRLDYGPKRKGLLDLRILDPGCGSGTFIILAIKRAIAHARMHQVKPEETLKKILINIHGFDLNPLAVIAARTNYLLALAELLPYKNKLPGGEIRIPIYLCDSINPPKAEIEGAGTLYAEEPTYLFRTTVGTFNFAAPLVKKQRLVSITPLIEECIKKNVPVDSFLKRAKEELDFKNEEWKTCQQCLQDTYAKLENLEKKQVNGIWANILKNAFAPLFVGQFDLIAGNPPWVNWEALPQHYRDVTQKLWIDYGLFSLKGHAARLGGGKKDLSMLFSYVAIDKYLKKSGRLGFVITQTVFKSQGAGDGFRRFRLGATGLHFCIEQLDDMVDLQPFEAATNRTSIFSCVKGNQQKYPVPYLLWRKSSVGSIDTIWNFDEVVKNTDRFKLEAIPVSGSLTGPWMCARNKALKALNKLNKPAAYRAYEGANSGGANGVYWVNIVGSKGDLIEIENLASVGKKKVKKVRCEIESTLLFPLLRGRDIGRWHAAPSAFQIVAQNSETRTGYSDDWMKKNAPKTREYLYLFEGILRDRSVFKKYQAGTAIWSQYGIGKYTFAKNKVVWSEVGQNLEAAVINSYDNRYLHEKIIIPDHTIVFIPLESESEAHYICALLNSSPTRLIIKAYVALHPSPHVMKNIGLAKFSGSEVLHKKLSDLSVLCHEKIASGIDISDLEEQIDDLAAELWGLSHDEMKAINESLSILNPPRKR